MKQCNNVTIYQYGFTLIELLIYISILGVVLAFTGEYLYSIGQARLSNFARMEVAQGAQLIINKLKSDLTNTTAIITPGDSTPVDHLDLILTGDYSVHYGLADDDIRRTYDSESHNLTSSQVRASNLNFQRIANPDGKENIQVKFHLESVAQMSGGRTVSEEFQTTVSRR